MHDAHPQNFDDLLELFTAGRFQDLNECAQMILASSLETESSAKIYNLLGASNFRQGNHSEAIQNYERAISIAPNYAQAFSNLGVALLEGNDSRSAVEMFKRALDLKPDLAEALTNLAAAFLKLGDYEKSIHASQRALKTTPQNSRAINTLGAAKLKQGHIEEAKNLFSAVKAGDPNFAESMNNLGNAYLQESRFQKALDCYWAAIEINPRFADAFANLGQAYKETGQRDASIKAFQKALEIDPWLTNAHLGLASIHLKFHNFKTGWEEMSYRFQSRTPDPVPFDTPRPFWKGEGVNRLLVWKEQGIGDEIMFNSCLNELAEKCEQLIVSATERLIPLFKRSFSSSITFISKDTQMDYSMYDWHVPALTALGYVRHDLKAFEKSNKPYLVADPCLVKRLSDEMTRLAGGSKIIGISWKTKNKEGLRRNLKLNELIDAIPEDAFLVNLQYGDVEEDLNGVKHMSGRSVFCCNDINNFNDLDGFAALISACDSVVSIDNSTVHFAGAIGTPCHLLLPYNASWRWGNNSDKQSYWYDKVYLHRQDAPENWESSIKAIRNAL